MGMTTLKKTPDHYGLSLILGGAEGTLWDITGMYASIARVLNNYFEHPGKNRYDLHDFHSPNYVLNPSLVTGSPKQESQLVENSLLGAPSIALVFDMLKEVYRPDEQSGWKYFNSTKAIAWKTGTSFGFRDGWAVGVTPHFVVGVWVGNADGTGRPGLTGTQTASPIMFDIFSQLKEEDWFLQMKGEMSRITVCAQSGHRSTPFCYPLDTILVASQGLQSSPCPYHSKIFLSPDRKYRINSSCSADKMIAENWFVLPPIQEFYFRQKNLSYKTLPPYHKSCLHELTAASMELIYPKPKSRVFVPRELDGSPGKVIFEVAHHNPNNLVYWHLDGKYVGYTRDLHQLSLHPLSGEHKIVLVDESGESLERSFEVISNK